eukprot:gnl/MRDRNA2_/MRDRNA2_80360_c0_seq1.p1 gnl/MRDRNA2_/MRDRNA2_80360_c0~~gnl/MRDRNA2_/MRDRNA2_80360_c0_seq1.p1  ORF type:complete len:521 (-),score=52.86 gnl/MRDRNA2_/MRDRNA2_80360_c0_seq1:42-1418(-)
MPRSSSLPTRVNLSAFLMPSEPVPTPKMIPPDVPWPLPDGIARTKSVPGAHSPPDSPKLQTFPPSPVRTSSMSQAKTKSPEHSPKIHSFPSAPARSSSVSRGHSSPGSPRLASPSMVLQNASRSQDYLPQLLNSQSSPSIPGQKLMLSPRSGSSPHRPAGKDHPNMQSSTLHSLPSAPARSSSVARGHSPPHSPTLASPSTALQSGSQSQRYSPRLLNSQASPSIPETQLVLSPRSGTSSHHPAGAEHSPAQSPRLHSLPSAPVRSSSMSRGHSPPHLMVSPRSSSSAHQPVGTEYSFAPPPTLHSLPSATARSSSTSQEHASPHSLRLASPSITLQSGAQSQRHSPSQSFNSKGSSSETRLVLSPRSDSSPRPPAGMLLRSASSPSAAMTAPPPAPVFSPEAQRRSPVGGVSSPQGPISLLRDTPKSMLASQAEYTLSEDSQYHSPKKSKIESIYTA